MPGMEQPKPYIDENGNLHIPFDSDPKYHHWKPGGQSIIETLKEINAPKEMFRNYMYEWEFEKMFGEVSDSEPSESQ